MVGLLLAVKTSSWTLSKPLLLPTPATHWPSPARLQAAPDSDSDNSNREAAVRLWAAIDEVGQGFKPRAVASSSKLAMAESKPLKLRYLLQTCAFFTLYTIYRGYRGFFVILPAVYREVVRKLQNAFADDVEINGNDSAVDPPGWQTRLTVRILAALVTAFYVCGGFLRIVKRFVQTLVEGRVTDSFAAAAEEQEATKRVCGAWPRKRVTRTVHSNRSQRSGHGPSQSTRQHDDGKHVF